MEYPRYRNSSAYGDIWPKSKFRICPISFEVRTLQITPAAPQITDTVARKREGQARKIQYQLTKSDFDAMTRGHGKPWLTVVRAPGLVTVVDPAYWVGIASLHSYIASPINLHTPQKDLQQRSDFILSFVYLSIRCSRAFPA
jgi:hypothetical protein